MHLLQVANVGQICGGTAACAWSVTRALPRCQHTILFLSSVTPETGKAFQHCRVLQANTVTEGLLKSIDPDVCLLHNTAPGRFPDQPSVPTVLYRHSLGERVRSHLDVCCSKWLACQVQTTCKNINTSRNMQGHIPRFSGNAPLVDEKNIRTPCSHGVLYQGVPLPPRPFPSESRWLRPYLIVGRICTPTVQKWPTELADFYSDLARRHPEIRWEFVGCRESLQADLQKACQGKARFHPASWKARKHLWRWNVLLYHHPTLTESFGRTAAEAMRAGCIPVVDHRGGFQEQVSPQTGFLCTTLPDFDAALKTLESPDRQRELSDQASEWANREFSLSAFSNRILNLFHQISTETRGTAGCTV